MFSTKTVTVTVNATNVIPSKTDTNYENSRSEIEVDQDCSYHGTE